MVEQVVDGVVRIETSACEGGSTGSVFLIGPDLVATVAHVVEDAVVISLRVGDSGQITAGTVVGIDPSREVALVATGRSLSGHVFTFADNPPRVGADVVALGYPGGAEQMSLTRGTVSGLDREIRPGNSALTDVIETDAVINPGNSGGPLLNTDGHVVGLVEAINTESVGLAYAVSTQTAQPLLEEWASNPNSVSSAACDTPTGSTDGYVDATDLSGDPRGPEILQTFRTWADGISTGDYPSGWAMYSQEYRASNSFDTWVDGNTTSYIPVLQIEDVADGERSDQVHALVQFGSLQAPEYGYDGQDCSIWTLEYTLLYEDAGWRISKATLVDGEGPEPC
jgi:serine protease Do